MNIPLKLTSSKQNWVRRTSGLAAGLGLLLLTGHAYADDPLLMAPPVDTGYTQATDVTSPDSAFNWSEVPSDQKVPIQRAVFDQGGYQLYDQVGETIVVPFTNQNLYVMKFGESTDGTMYFVHEGNVPVLYVPRDGFLENAAVPGARWYPFSDTFHPDHPVFLGIAPSWHVFVGMGWYSGMYCHGGYWSDAPYFEGSLFLPSFGLFFEIGGHHYDGWNSYHDYYYRHPAPYHVTIVNNYVYDHASRSDRGGRQFQGAGSHDYTSHTFGQGRTYPTDRVGSGGDRTFGSSHTFRGTAGGGSAFSGRPLSEDRTQDHSQDHTLTSGSHTFSGGRPFGADRTGSQSQPAATDHTFGGGTRANSSGTDHAFSGGTGRPANGSGTDAPAYSNRAGHTFGGSVHTDSGSRPAASDHASDTGHANSGDTGRVNSDNGGDRSFSGGGERSSGSSDGGRSFGGSDGGGRSFGGRSR